MAAKKKLSAKVRQAVAKAKPKKTFFIIQMPEDQDEAPHWLFWMLLIVFVALLLSNFLRNSDGFAEIEPET